MAYAMNTPGTIGAITEPLEIKNIGIDGKTYQIADARMSMVQGMDLKIGEKVEYKIAKQGDITLKGKINFLARKEQPGTTQPAQEKTMESASPKSEPRIITGQFIEKKGLQIIIKEEDNVNHVYTADLDVMKVLSAADSKVKSGDNVSVMLLKVDGKEVAHKIGPGALGEQFKSGKEILQENLDAKSAETAASSVSETPSLCKGCEADLYCPTHDPKGGCLNAAKAALETKKKEDAAGDARINENAEFAESLAKASQTVPATQPPKEPENVAQKEAMALSAPSKEILPATGGVELAVHVNLGNYSSFDLKVTGINGEHARQLLQQEAAPTIALVKGIIKNASKVY
jgi:hypothetical protein